MKKDWKFLVSMLVAIILILLVANYTLSIKNKLYTKGEVQEATGVIEEVKQGMEVTQSFVAIDNNLEKVIINFEGYKDDDKCGGKVLVGIKDSDGNTIKERQITRNYIRENPEYTLNFKKQKDSKDKEYSIYIKFNDLGKAERFYTLQKTDKNEFLKNKLYIDGKEEPSSSLIFQDLYKSNIRTLIYTGTMALMIVGVVAISIVIYSKKNIEKRVL